jgi:hypothetical protein
MPIIKLKKTRKKKEFDLSGVRRSARFKNKTDFSGILMVSVILQNIYLSKKL